MPAIRDLWTAGAWRQIENGDRLDNAGREIFTLAGWFGRVSRGTREIWPDVRRGGMAEWSMAVVVADRLSKVNMGKQGSGAIYGMAVIGAAVYYIRHAVSVSAGAIGILKAILWPAILIYKVLELLKM